MKDLWDWNKFNWIFVDGIMISLQSIVSAAFIESLSIKMHTYYYLEFNKLQITNSNFRRVSVGIFLLTNIILLPSIIQNGHAVT